MANPDRSQAVVLSREVATVGAEWAESGHVRLRRRIVTEVQTIEVTVRREELVIESDDVEFYDGVGIGSVEPGAAVAPSPANHAPLVIVLQREVPEITLHLQPYERVTVAKTLRTRDVRVVTAVRHEEAALDQTRSGSGV